MSKVKTSCQVENGIMDAIDALGAEEMRNRNNMLTVLLVEALTARGVQFDDPGHDTDDSQSGRPVADYLHP